MPPMSSPDIPHYTVRHLTLPELIRMNQLVRGGVDFAGFQAWYDSISADDQATLILHLNEFAFQASCDTELIGKALTAAQLSEEDTLIRKAGLFRAGFSREYGHLHIWLFGLQAEERATVFRMYVFMFGFAEERVYRQETEESCNHWWHRDLLDERVVESLLHDSRFWATSMRDDSRVKANHIPC